MAPAVTKAGTPSFSLHKTLAVRLRDLCLDETLVVRLRDLCLGSLAAGPSGDCVVLVRLPILERAGETIKLLRRETTAVVTTELARLRPTVGV
eukprot:CAMPEP_0194734026 /NCGR_PEP_ID=MMETSP0296-20130528/67817_1 /TAXON_ID=39354 /ORGANISM="Heterosigma akashiwo, Strain CCMP2393" /LENGTH=92 /DNA_ID=CAMNT_0039642635 /DNA_START=365 /DNA_END=640 /DNA_ORIENTATION=-